MKRIGEILVGNGWIEQDVLDRALAKQREIPRRLCSLLVAAGVLDSDLASRALGEQLGVAAVLQKHLDHRDRSLAALIPAEIARAWWVLPIGRLGNGDLIVCARDPRPSVLATLQAVLGDTIVLAVGPAAQVESLVVETYGAPEEDFDVDMSTGPIASLDLDPLPDEGDPMGSLGNLQLVELDDQGVTRDPTQSGLLQLGGQRVSPLSSVGLRVPPTQPPPTAPRPDIVVIEPPPRPPGKRAQSEPVLIIDSPPSREAREADAARPPGKTPAERAAELAARQAAELAAQEAARQATERAAAAPAPRAKSAAEQAAELAAQLPAEPSGPARLLARPEPPAEPVVIRPRRQSRPPTMDDGWEAPDVEARPSAGTRPPPIADTPTVEPPSTAPAPSVPASAAAAAPAPSPAPADPAPSDASASSAAPAAPSATPAPPTLPAQPRSAASIPKRITKPIERTMPMPRVIRPAAEPTSPPPLKKPPPVHAITKPPDATPAPPPRAETAPIALAPRVKAATPSSGVLATTSTSAAPVPPPTPAAAPPAHAPPTPTAAPPAPASPTPAAAPSRPAPPTTPPATGGELAAATAVAPSGRAAPPLPSIVPSRAEPPLPPDAPQSRINAERIASAHAAPPPAYDGAIAAGTVRPLRRTHAPPVGLADTLDALAAVKTRDDATAAAMRFAKGRWRAALLLEIKEKSATGEAGHGLLLTEDVVASLVIPLAVPSIVGLALEARRLTTDLPREESPVQDRLDRLLGMPRFPAAAPILLRGYPAYVVVIGDPTADDTDAATNDLDRLASALAGALARVTAG